MRSLFRCRALIGFLVLAVLICLCVAASAAVVDEGSCGEYATYTLDDAGKLVISGTGLLWDNVFEPYCYDLANDIKTVVIENGIEEIPVYAFTGCSSLTGITIPNSVTSIRYGAFSNCSSLKSITIPNGVTSIGEIAFEYCSSLTSVTISNSVTSIDERAFSYCSSLTSITIPNSVTSIGYGAFTGCSSLNKVTLPTGLTYIGESAFKDCALTKVTVYENLNDIGYEAFDSNVTIQAPEGSYAAEWAAESGYDVVISGEGYKITVYTDDENEGTVSASADSAKEGTEVILKATPKTGYKFVKWHVEEGGVTIKDDKFKVGTSNVKIRGEFAKADETNVEYKGGEYKLDPDKKTAVYLRPTDKNITSVSIPSTIKVDGKKYKVVAIAAKAFNGCTKLKKCTIGSNVKEIGKNAFYKCKKLKTFEIKTTKLTEKGIGKNCFKGGYSKPTFKCPKKCKDDYSNWFVKIGKAPKKSKFK